MKTKRRRFLKQSALMSAGVMIGAHSILNGGLSASAFSALNLTNSTDQKFKLSLAQWSFHKAFFGGKMDHLDFASKAKELGFEGIEYVNQFFFDKATNADYLKEISLVDQFESREV